MAVFSVNAYALSDFTGTITDPGLFSAPWNIQFQSTTLSGSAVEITFNITDDDASLEDGYVETGAYATLTSDVTINGTTYPAGSIVEAEYSVGLEDGNTIYIIRFGSATENTGENVLVVSENPLVPGTTYDFGPGGDGPAVPFSTICFVGDTQIATPDGAAAVQDLKIGDLVVNRDGLEKPIRWIGQHKFSPQTLMFHQNLRPVRIPAGALGAGLPLRDLCVSPQHRIGLSDWRGELLFGHGEFLVAAKALCGERGIKAYVPDTELTYFHILLDEHEVLVAEGQWADSLLLGPQALATLEEGQRDEVTALFPEMKEFEGKSVTPALPCLKVQEYRTLARHAADMSRAS